MFRLIDENNKVKYAGRSKAVVLDNRDPLNRGRIIVDHPLLGPTVWIDYLMTPGQFNVPSIDDVVYVEADGGYAEFPIAWGNVIMGEDASPDTPQEFIRDIPTNRGWKTPGGHILELDDGIATVIQEVDDTNFTTKNRGIRITTSGGNKIHIAEDSDNSSESILIENNDGSSFLIDKTNKKMVWTDSANSITIDKNDNTITAKNSKNQIFKLADHQILGQGTEHMVLGDTWFTMMNTFLTSVISGIMPGSPGQNAQSLIQIKQAATTLQNSLPNLKSQNSYTD